ncbi:hypothetical protein BP6252_08898 [Coleophoma cylindrospora]|uniref:Uncharacterized protein n=1 Tax=Coleophoma cylindrospora TaxID=1849047 RepID=A0A3D8R7H5_9HELO|nr:hypothetical protein BP6252_08898 [Coleophoma cylindrospora]
MPRSALSGRPGILRISVRREGRGVLGGWYILWTEHRRTGITMLPSPDPAQRKSRFTTILFGRHDPPRQSRPKASRVALSLAWWWQMDDGMADSRRVAWSRWDGPF